MSLLLDDEYCLRIWKKDTIRSLLWFVDRHNANDSTASFGGIQAPSWSWVHLNRPISYRLWQPYDRYIDRKAEEFMELATVKTMSARQENPGKLNAFTGILEIEGSFVDAVLWKSSIYIYRLKEQEPSQTVDSDDEAALKKSLEGVGTAADPTKEIFYKAPLFTDDTDCIAILQKVRRVKCLLLAQGGYTDMLTAQYSIVLLEQQHNIEPKVSLTELNRENWERVGETLVGTLVLRPPPTVSLQYRPQPSMSRPRRYRRIGLCATDPGQVCLSAQMKCSRCSSNRERKDCLGEHGQFSRMNYRNS